MSAVSLAKSNTTHQHEAKPNESSLLQIGTSEQWTMDNGMKRLTLEVKDQGHMTLKKFAFQ